MDPPVGLYAIRRHHALGLALHKGGRVSLRLASVRASLPKDGSVLDTILRALKG